MPLSTLQMTPHDVTRKTRGQDGFATSFPAGILPPLQHAGLSRRSPICRLFGSVKPTMCLVGWRSHRYCAFECAAFSMSPARPGTQTHRSFKDLLRLTPCRGWEYAMATIVIKATVNRAKRLLGF